MPTFVLVLPLAASVLCNHLDGFGALERNQTAPLHQLHRDVTIKRVEQSLDVWNILTTPLQCERNQWTDAVPPPTPTQPEGDCTLSS